MSWIYHRYFYSISTFRYIRSKNLWLKLLKMLLVIHNCKCISNFKTIFLSYIINRYIISRYVFCNTCHLKMRYYRINLTPHIRFIWCIYSNVIHSIKIPLNKKNLKRFHPIEILYNLIQILITNETTFTIKIRNRCHLQNRYAPNGTSIKNIDMKDSYSISTFISTNVSLNAKLWNVV